MGANIQWAILNFNRVWNLFEHNGRKLTRMEVMALLNYGLSKGYASTSQLADDEIDMVLSECNTSV